MSKTKLVAGAELDIFSGAEATDLFGETNKSLKDLLEKVASPGQFVRSQTEVSTDASGNLGGGLSGSGLFLYTVPSGYTAFLHRVQINAAGYTAASPLTSGSIQISRNGNTPLNMIYFLPISGNVAPVVITEGSNSAYWLNSGDNVVITGGSLPDTLTIYFSFQFRLWKTNQREIVA